MTWHRIATALAVVAALGGLTATADAQRSTTPSPQGPPSPPAAPASLAHPPAPVRTPAPPAAAPAASTNVGSDYVIGPEDVLQISVWKNEALSRVVPVRPDGKITLPLLNDVTAAGL